MHPNGRDYQPGGTVVLVQNKWATRFLSQGLDSRGRWSWIILMGKGMTKVMFLLAYHVCEGSSGSFITSKTVRVQQEWLYAEKGIPQVNLREQCILNLQRLIVKFHSEGHKIVLMMDANEGSKLRSGVDRLIQWCRLVEAHAAVGTSPPPTYQHRSKKINFVLISPRLAAAVVQRVSYL
jgi:hypothetical protein